MSYEVYKVLHLLGVMLLFLSLGGIALNGVRGGDRESLGGARKLAAVTHGIAMLLLIFGGFGLMARLGISHTNPTGWVLAKIGIWILMGGSIAILLRKAEWSKAMWFALPLLGAVAVWLAVVKPG